MTGSKEEDPRAKEAEEILKSVRGKLPGIRLEIPALEALARSGAPDVEEPPSRREVQPRRAPKPAAAPAKAAAAAPAPAPVQAAAPAPAPVVAAAPVPSLAPAPRTAARPPETRAPGAPSLSLRVALVLFVTAVFAVLGVFEWRARVAQELHRSFPLPFPRAAGPALHGGILYALDPARQLLFGFATDTGLIRSVQKFRNPSAGGLAWGGNCFWSADSGIGAVYQHNLDWLHTVRKTYAVQELSPSAIYWDGSHLWAADPMTGTVYEYSAGETLAPVRQFPLPGIVPAGIHVTEEALWVLDSAARKILRYRLNTLPIPLDSLGLDPWLPAGSSVTGFAVGTDALWLVTEKPAELHQFDLKRLPWASHRHQPGGLSGPL